MGFVVIAPDKAATAALGGGSYVAGLPLSNVKTDDIHSVARTSSADNADTIIEVDLGLVTSVGGIAIGPTNLSPGASWRARLYENEDFTGLLYDSGLIENEGSVVDWSDPNDWLEWEDPDFWLGIRSGDLDELPLVLSHVVPAASAGAATGRYWKIEFYDEDNVDGYIDIGRLLMGPVYRPSVNYAEGGEFSFEAITDVTESLGGYRTYWNRGLRRTIRCAWPLIPESEAFVEWYRLMLKLRTDRQMFVIPEEFDEPDMIRKRAFFATFKTIPAIAQIVYQNASVAFDAEEVL